MDGLNYGELIMDILDVITREDYRIYRIYRMGMYETYLFKPHIYMPLVRYSNRRIGDLTWENL